MSNMIDSIEAGLAPRNAKAWAALLTMLGDGEEHARAECIKVMMATGVAERTAVNLLGEGDRTGRIIARWGGRKTKRSPRGRRVAFGRKDGSVVRTVATEQRPNRTTEPNDGSVAHPAGAIS